MAGLVTGERAFTSMTDKPILEAVRVKGERHRLTVLFSDMAGSTALGREMEAEHYAELLGNLRDIWHLAAAKHGGRVIRTQGDGALVDLWLSAVGRGRRPASRRGRPRHPRMGRPDCATTACLRLFCRCECIRASMPALCSYAKAILNPAGWI